MVRDVATRTPVSIVCVFNDSQVLQTCLARSIDAGRSDAPSTEFIPVDNRSAQFATAGAALNHGAEHATNDVIVFVHQDVYLHSLPELEKAAHELLAAEDVGVMGAIGIDGRQALHGAIRDRVLALGEPASVARDIQTLDEVLFMVPRRRLIESPLADDPLLGWHAYAVEYCTRVRAAGSRAVARDIPLTHNSMTTNLARLDVAHRWVADRYPHMLPIETTCGTIRRSRLPRLLQLVKRRARTAGVWFDESLAAKAIAGHAQVENVLLADIRFAVDDLADSVGADSIRAIDVFRRRTQGVAGATSVDGLVRRERAFTASSVPIDQIADELAQRHERTLLVITNLGNDDLRQIRDQLVSPFLVGFSREAGIWVACGATIRDLPEALRSPRRSPFAGLIRLGSARKGRRHVV